MYAEVMVLIAIEDFKLSCHSKTAMDCCQHDRKSDFQVMMKMGIPNLSPHDQP